jgi:hypothetical protein
MTIAVIGHGRSPEGRGWGSKIDSCSTVIRLWDWYGWQGVADYGEKYSYGLFVLTPKGLSAFTSYHKIVPARKWLAYLGKPVRGDLPNGVPIEIVDPSPWVAEAQAMGGAGLSGRLTLTRGFVAAAWALCCTPYPDNVVLVGFDNVKLGINQPIEKSFCPEYWKMFNSRFESKLDKSYPVGHSKTETHDMAVEAPLLFKLAGDRGLKLDYAEEIWG